MAEKSIPSESVEPKAIPEVVEFFELSGKYQVAPLASAIDLHNDIHCWLESAQEIVSTVANGLQEDGGQFEANPRAVARLLYGADHFLTMIKGALHASLRMDGGVRHG